MKTLVWVGSEVGPTFTSEKLSQDYDFSSGPIEVDDGDALELIRSVGRSLLDVSEFEALGISSVPSNVDYAYIVAKSKVGVDDTPIDVTTWAFRGAMPVSSADITASTQLVGCVSMLPGGTLQASDGTNVSSLPIPGGWEAGDELVICLTVDPITETMILWRPEL